MDSVSALILEALADQAAAEVVRTLLPEPMSQAELVAATPYSQSRISRISQNLVSVGLVSATVHDGRRAKLQVEHPTRVVHLLQSVDRLAEEILQSRLDAQARASAETQRAAVRPAAAKRALTEGPA